MNQKSNNDIDILLRRLSRQDGNTSNTASDGQHAAQKHLDADELNAYAENALPSALRASYTEHLTECTTCRKMVTQLSLAAATVVPSNVEEARPSALKTFLAGLFSPLVFRYAIPAMAMVVVVAIAWVALQRRSPNSEVAQSVSRQEDTPSPAPGIMSREATNTGELKGRVSEQKEVPSRAGEKSGERADAPPENKQEAAAEEQKLAAKTADDSREREEVSKRNQQQPVASAAAPATGAGGTVTVTATKSDAVTERNVEVAQKKESSADKAKVMNEPQSTVSSAASRPAKAPEAKPVPKSTPAETAETSRGLRRAELRDKDETGSGEVRTVAGHRFRKQGQVWIDTLYSSQPITNVSRGSEQYRALVADEPGIRSIAEQLNAEFIVVWKSRAYRIR